jgi:isoleucyl-tRNA synthetase
VHLAEFPDVENREDDRALLERWNDREKGILHIRSVVQQHLEIARTQKIIGASLEAKVNVLAGENQFNLLKSIEDELTAIFIVSQVVLSKGESEELVVKVAHADGAKCERCWNWSEIVGRDPRFPTLDERCIRQIEEGWMVE